MIFLKLIFVPFLINLCSSATLEDNVRNLLAVADAVVDVLLPVKPVPVLDENIWWGKGDPADQDTSIRPFQVAFKAERIEKLRQKLSQRENLTRSLDNSASTYGLNIDYLDQVLDYWQNKYDFKTSEANLNLYPSFITNIQGLDIHYYHIEPESTGKKVVPLLMLHGWPVSNMEYLYVVARLVELTKEEDYNFDIIVPSIPGFGYSEATSKTGLNSYQIAIIFKNLMKKLGYQKFYIHAGDFGEIISADMMTIYQDDVLGLHTNFPYSLRPKTLAKYVIGSLYNPAVVEPQYAERLYPLTSVLYYILYNFGYFHQQGSKTDMLGVALQDSPAGLAAWILSGAIFTTNPDYINRVDGGIPLAYSIDDLLDVFTVIWDAQCITTSSRLYAEFSAMIRDPLQFQILITPTKVPYSCIKFRHEVIYQPDAFIRDKYPNLVHSTTVDVGGHFAAIENPDILATDIIDGINAMISFNEKKITAEDEDFCV